MGEVEKQSCGPQTFFVFYSLSVTVTLVLFYSIPRPVGPSGGRFEKVIAFVYSHVHIDPHGAQEAVSMGHNGQTRLAGQYDLINKPAVAPFSAFA